MDKISFINAELDRIHSLCDSIDDLQRVDQLLVWLYKEAFHKDGFELPEDDEEGMEHD